MNQEDDFLNKRVRLQRLSDLKFFSGWCTQLKGQACAIVINPSKSPYAVGDEFSAEIYGAEKRAVVTVQLTRIGSEGCEFMLKSPLRLLQTDEEARFLVSGLSGQLYYDDEAISCQAIDISPHGLGGEVSEEILRGRKVKFKFMTHLGDVKGDAEVRYCREVSAGRYRIGLRIPELARMESGRWMALMHDPSEQP